jgi:hypothetical protein
MAADHRSSGVGRPLPWHHDHSNGSTSAHSSSLINRGGGMEPRTRHRASAVPAGHIKPPHRRLQCLVEAACGTHRARLLPPAGQIPESFRIGEVPLACTLAYRSLSPRRARGRAGGRHPYGSVPNVAAEAFEDGSGPAIGRRCPTGPRRVASAPCAAIRPLADCQRREHQERRCRTCAALGSLRGAPQP